MLQSAWIQMSASSYDYFILMLMIPGNNSE